MQTRQLYRNIFYPQDQVDLTRVTLIGPVTEEKLQSAFDFVIDTAQDFTDSAYTSHMNREKILSLSDTLKDELQDLLKVGQSLVSCPRRHSPLTLALLNTKL